MNFETYNARRRYYEAGIWIAIIAINIVANAVVINLEQTRNGSASALWEPWVWEASSGLMWLALIPVLLAFDRRFPLQRGALARNGLKHLAFTVPFSLMHVGGMVAIRHGVYWLAGGHYDFGNVPRQLFYEYLKDFRTYASFLGPIYLYRFVLRRWQGEASLPDRDEADSAPADRFLVKKLGKEFLVRIEDIDWLESSGNYVNLHAHGRVYPLRDTMSNMELRLKGQGFARVHRSAIVNLDRIAEIEPFDTGDARAHLSSGEQVPVSRRYRTELRERLG